jgi:hypothetical protein
MNTQALSHYEEFTPEERVRLTLAALARGDIEEMMRLMNTCPRMTLVGPDPEYPKRLDRVRRVSANVLLRWVDVSHLVFRLWMARCTLEYFASAAAYDSARVDAAKGDNTKKPKGMVRECRAGAAQAKARYKSLSAEWKAIESAIARFCTELELTGDQLFALMEVLPRAIEEASGILDADAAANRAISKEIYDQLCRAWFGDSKPK